MAKQQVGPSNTDISGMLVFGHMTHVGQLLLQGEFRTTVSIVNRNKLDMLEVFG